MMEYIERVSVINSNIVNKDLEKLIFPIMIEEIYDIRLVNITTKKELTYKDDAFSDASNVIANKGDIIYISFAAETPRVEILLEISEIFRYSCGIMDIMKIRAYRGEYDYKFGGVRLNIMDRNDYINEMNPSKLFIDIQLDIITIEANKVVIKEVKYIE